MTEILFLAHRIPYPPNKGDKIRSYHILRYLAESYRVHLGAFVDDPADHRHRAALAGLCGELCLLPLAPAWARLRSLRGFWQGSPLTLPYYRDGRMSRWVRDLVARRPVAAVFVFSSAMAQYAEGFRGGPRLLDFVDVDSDKWRQYAGKKSWPASWLYRREADRLLRYERRVAAEFDRSLFVSEQEAALFRRLAPTAERVMALANGVDTAFFDPGEDYSDPYPAGEDVLVFTGAMDYWPNVDAVRWFAHEVFPELARHRPSARFVVVGARPTEAVRELARRDGVRVTGAVADIRPYLRHARVAVAPLRIARGIQNKVLEAMAMARPVVVSPAALEGLELDLDLGLTLAVAGEPADWVRVLRGMLERPAGDAPGNRRFVLSRYGWEHNLEPLRSLLAGIMKRGELCESGTA